MLIALLSCEKNDQPSLPVSDIAEKKDSTGKPIYAIFFPEAFSPNGDAYDDYFAPEGYGFERNMLLEVYDPYDQLLFYTQDTGYWWNGRVHEGRSISQEGAYPYRFSFTDTEGGRHAYNGTVILVK